MCATTSRPAAPDLLQGLLQFAYAGPGVRRWNITRVAMYRALENRLADLDGPDRSCLCISSSEALARVAGLVLEQVEGGPGGR
jgi:hypothetical protein